MSNRPAIDEIFKSQLGEIPVAGKEQMWQRMEQKLDAENKRGALKKRYSLLLLLLLGITTATIYLTNNHSANNHSAKNIVSADPFVQTPAKQSQDDIASQRSSAIASLPNNNNGLTPTDAGSSSAADPKTVNNKSFAENGRQNIMIQSAQPETTNEAVEPEIERPVVTIGSPAVTKTETPTTITTSIKPNEPVTQKGEQPLATTSADKKAEKNKEKKSNGITFGLSGGMDIFLKAKETGSYGGLQLTIPVNKKVNVVTGLQVSKHKMEENYSNAEKQRVNPDKNIDAKLEGLTVLQVPILYEQPLPGNKIKFRAGLTPTYIINAGIYNVPNSFNGNAANYKKFTLEDLHRLNVLFTAAVGVAITRNIELELKGNYGMTELVKNSYINQSSVNNNFKSAQVGIILKPGKKKK